jgi:hypothetical protein
MSNAPTEGGGKSLDNYKLSRQVRHLKIQSPSFTGALPMPLAKRAQSNHRTTQFQLRSRHYAIGITK